MLLTAKLQGAKKSKNLPMPVWMIYCLNNQITLIGMGP